MATDPTTSRRRFPRAAAWFARPRRLSCQEMVELVTEYLDGALDAPTRTRFEHHLEKCDGCATYLEGLRVTVAMLGGLTEDRLDPVLRDRLMLAFEGTTGSW